MNICFVTSDYVSPTRGGIEKVTFTLSNALINRGHSVDIISKDHPKNGDEVLNNHFILPSQNISSDENLSFLQSFISKKKIDILVNQSHHKAVFDLLVKAKGANKLKIITVLHTDPACILKEIVDQYEEIIFKNSKWNIGSILSATSWLMRFPYRYYSRYRYLSFKYRTMYEESDAYILLSNSFRKKFIQIAKLKNDIKLHAIGNPVTIQTQKATKKKKQLLFVGRMEFSPKRPDRIIKIWEKIYKVFPDWSLYMLGDGPIKESLIQYCNQRNIENIYFTGNTSTHDYYKESAILCMVSSYEGFGLVLTEAQQNSVIPVVYDSFESVRDIIENEKTGFIIRAFCRDKYIKALTKLMRNKTLRKNMTHNINESQMTSSFNINVIVCQWEQLFKNLLTDNKNRV